MPRQSVPERGALIVGHIYPNTFAWSIRTGPAVDRAALASAIVDLNAVDIYRMARTLAAGRDATSVNTGLISDRACEKFAKITRRALGARYVNDSHDPKSDIRIETEKLMIRATLELAARVVRSRRVEG